MKTWIVWKVVDATNREGVYESVALVPNDRAFYRTYQVGKVTTPPPRHPEALLFAFRSLKDAQEFARGSAMKIFRARTTQQPQEADRMAYGIDWRSLVEFWRDPSRGEVWVPRGTVLCADIELLKEVQ